MSRKTEIQRFNRLRRQQLDNHEEHLEPKTRFSIPMIIILSVVLLFLLFLFISVPIRRHINRNVAFRTSATNFQILKNGEWTDFLIKGVNIGASKAGYFAGDLAITKRDYTRWFYQISDMNANVIRVYTVLEPVFYEALYEYNVTAANPLYVFHGIWHDESLVAKYNNGFEPELLNQYLQQITYVIDALHGNAEIAPVTGEASGRFRRDISPFVVGYIMGIEQDANFVLGTVLPSDLSSLSGITRDSSNNVAGFKGQFLETKAGASDYEIWLAYVGDYALQYESKNYNSTRSLSWVNWLTTDPFTHTSEPEIDEDRAQVDTENIVALDTFKEGLFASYHAYPYYPEFMMLQPEYISYVDVNGNINPYEAYLKDLINHHRVPVLISEFGIPSSRGKSHVNTVTGFNQGGVSEQESGEKVAYMFESIVRTGCAGGMVFSWQDEWFKASWNTMEFDIAQRRAYWSNFHTAEQSFGLLSFDPGTIRTPVQVDGDTSEWEQRHIIASKQTMSLSMMSDERHLYFMIRDTALDLSNHEYVIGIDSLANQGNATCVDQGLSFANEVEHFIHIKDKQDVTVYVDAYYDAFYRRYSLEPHAKVIDQDPRFETKNSGIFHPIRLLLRYPMVLPLTGEIWPVDYYEVGQLVQGNSNPKSPDFNSLSDYNINESEGTIEIRIPWNLINVADPSRLTMIGDLYAYPTFNINPTVITGLNLQLQKVKDHSRVLDASGTFAWAQWDEPTYHERLKASYPILQETFRNHGLPNQDGGRLHRMMKVLGVGVYGHANSSNDRAFSPEGLASLSYQTVEHVIVVLLVIFTLMCLSVLIMRLNQARIDRRIRLYWQDVHMDYDLLFTSASKDIPLNQYHEKAQTITSDQEHPFEQTWNYQLMQYNDTFEAAFQIIQSKTKRLYELNCLEDQLLEVINSDQLILRDIARQIAYRLHLPEKAFHKVKTSRNNNIIATNGRKLGIYRYKESSDLLLEKLDILSTDIQYQVLMAFARMGAAEAFAQGLQKVFDHLMLNDRTLITIIKSYRGDRRLLFDVIMKQSNKILKFTYLNALEPKEVQDHVQEILPYIKDEFMDLRLAAITSIGSILDRQYIDSLLRGFEDDSLVVRVRTALVFGNLICQEAVPGLIDVACGEHWWARQTAINSILAYPNAEEILTQVVLRHDSYAYSNVVYALERDDREDILASVKRVWETLNHK